MKMKVEFEPVGKNTVGETVVFKVKPRHLVQFEDEVGVFSETAKSAYTLAWMASDTQKPFKEWLATVEDIETIGVEQATPPAAEGESEGEGEAVPTS